MPNRQNPPSANASKPTVDSHSDPTGVPSRRGHRLSGTALAFHVIERFFLLAGVVLFVFLIRRIGPHSVLENLRLIGWGFFLIVAQEALAATANTLGWRHAFRQPCAAIPFRQLFAARVAGDGINCVTPTATIGGEFVRARMIDGVADATAVWASVAVAKITQTVAQAVFILLGLLFVATHTPLPAVVRDGLMVGVPLFVALVVLTVALQHRGLFTTGVRLLRFLRVPVPARVGNRLQHLDDEIRRIYAAPSSFLLSTGFFLLGWLCGLIEIYLILHFLQVGASWQRALSIEALSVTVDGLFFFVPAKAGTQEGGKVLIFSILGLDPAKGFTLGIVRRIRELCWAGIGLLFLSRSQLGRRGRASDSEGKRHHQ
jgi:glycosyltransferase 2 family protein